jgi:hypothetical protein
MPFCERPNKKPEGFAKQKQPAIFAMRHSSHLVLHHPSLIYNVFYNHRNTFATYTTKKIFATRSVSVHPSDIPHFAMFNHTQNIAHFTIQNVSLKTLRITGNRKLALFDASHFVFEYVSQTSSQIFTKLSGGGCITSYDVR